MNEEYLFLPCVRDGAGVKARVEFLVSILNCDPFHSGELLNVEHVLCIDSFRLK